MASLDTRAILGRDGAVARRLPGYEPRDEQLRMAEAVAETIAEPGHLMVEAGTGVGKSFAYLVPAILAVAEQDRRVVVSTQTINLQEQLVRKDLPFLRAVMPHEFSAALVKGRSNYISLRRLRAASARAGASFDLDTDRRQLEDLARWAVASQDGSRSELTFRPSAEVWESVESDHGNCLGKHCPSFRDCHYYKAQRRAWNANILVVNHALYMVDLAVRSRGGAILPDHDVAIFDEAHTLAEVAAEHLGLRVTSGAVVRHLMRLFNARTGKGLLVYHRLGEAQAQASRALAATDSFFDSAARWCQSQPRPNGHAQRPTGLPATLADELARLGSAIRLGSEGVSDPEQRIELESAAVRTESFGEALQTWLDQSEPDSVYWVEAEASRHRRIALACSPLEVGPVLRRELFENVPSCILTSATLSTGTREGFPFFQSRLGLEGCRTLSLGSPFDFQRQVRLHLVRDLPDPSAEPALFERLSVAAIRHYLELSQGGALVLFTSYRHLAEAARVLRPWLEGRGVRLLSQADGISRTTLIDEFKREITSVLFGVESFWQGVDVPGEALSNVIIVKLPFSVPDHPLLEAQLERIQRSGGNKFRDYQVPEAIIRLKQGFGRLIRSRTDRGMVAILDPRVLTKPYGRQFLNSLPLCERQVDELGLGA